MGGRYGEVEVIPNHLCHHFDLILPQRKGYLSIIDINYSYIIDLYPYFIMNVCFIMLNKILFFELKFIVCSFIAFRHYLQFLLLVIELYYHFFVATWRQWFAMGRSSCTRACGWCWVAKFCKLEVICFIFWGVGCLSWGL